MIVAESKYSLQQYIEIGQILLDEGRFTEAIVLYEAALATYPETAAIYQVLGFAQEKENQIHDSAHSYRTAIRLDPQSPIWVYIALCNLLSEQNQWQEAFTLYQQGIMHHPDQGDLYRGLGLVQDKLAHQADAISSYHQAITLKPEQPLWVYTTLGSLMNQQQDWATLMQIYIQAIRIYPDQADLYRELGFVQEKLADIPGEIQSYQRAIELGNQPLWVYTTLVDLLSRQADSSRAIEVCLAGLAAYPNQLEMIQRLERLKQPQSTEGVGCSLDWYWRQAEDRIRQEKYLEAQEVYLTAIHHYPDRAELYRELGIVQEKLGDDQGEISSYQQAVNLDPQQPAWVYSTLATLLSKQGQFDQAITVFEHSLREYPREISNLRQFVKVLLANQKYDRSEEICHLILAFRQDDPWIFKELAETQYQQGKIEDAFQSILTANQLLPNNCWLKWELGSILLKKGDEPEAAYQLQAVIDDSGAPDWLKVRCLKALANMHGQDSLQQKLRYYQAFHLDRNDIALKDKSLELLKLLTADIADFYFRYHMWMEAKGMYQQLCILDPNNPQTHYRLGNILEQTGNKEEAIKVYELCTKLSPDNITYLEKLGDLMSSYGKCYSFQELCFP